MRKTAVATAADPVTAATEVCRGGLALNEKGFIYKLTLPTDWNHLVTIAKTLKACRLVCEVESVEEGKVNAYGVRRVP
jgi:hypothetical protein